MPPNIKYVNNNTEDNDKTYSDDQELEIAHLHQGIEDLNEKINKKNKSLEKLQQQKAVERVPKLPKCRHWNIGYCNEVTR